MQTTPAADVDHNVQRLADALEIASRQAADVLVTPEMFLSGYNIGPDAVRRTAQPLGGEHVERLADLASGAGVSGIDRSMIFAQ